MTDGGPLSKRVLAGTAWMAGGRVLVRSIGIVSTVILARLLDPSDFGLVALATAFIAILSAFSDLSFASALIAFQDATEEDYRTAWTLNLLRGLFMAAVLVLAAWPVADVLGEQRLAMVIATLSLVAIMDGTTNTRFVQFERELSFRPAFVVMVAVKIVGFATTVSLALAYRSYWALVLGMLAVSLTRVAMGYVLRPWRPRLSLRSSRRLLAFTGWLTGSNAIMALSTQLDSFILKLVLNLESAGLFHVAKDISLGVFKELMAPVRRVMFPTLSHLREDPAAMRSVYEESSAVFVSVMLPVCVGLALVAPDVVRLFLGEKWVGTIFAVELVSVMVGFQLLSSNATALVMARGETRMLFKRVLAYAPVRPLLFTAGTLYSGLEGGVVGFFVSGLILGLIDLHIVSRLIGVTVPRQIAWCSRSIVSVLLMSAGVSLFRETWTMSHPQGLLFARLVLSVILGAMIYTLAHGVLWWIGGRPAGPETRLIGLLRRDGTASLTAPEP